LLAGNIDLRPSSPDEFYLSQSANYRHKIDGLPYRLMQSNKIGEWAPKKRVSVNSKKLKLSKQRIKALAVRSVLRDESHSRYSHFRKSRGVLGFRIQMLPLVIKYHFFAGSLTKFIAKELIKFQRKLFRFK
jgi:hypothetical protein